MKIAVVTFPGSNCDYDCYKAVQAVGAEPEFVWHRAESLGRAEAVVLPGGFSYGDYLRPGAIARMSPIMELVTDFARGGGPVIGICNGFQILCEAGLLPGALLRNRSLKFQSHDTHLRVETTDTPFTSAYRVGQVLRMPLAHADGNYYADAETLERLEDQAQVVFRYVHADGTMDDTSNPNGSAGNIAGIRNTEGNVLGMMPHPDRATSEVLGSTDGIGVFNSMVASLSTVAG